MRGGWNKETLGDVLALIRNGVNCKQNKKGIGDKVSRIETISNGEFDSDRVGYANLSNSEKEKYRLLKGDVLFSHINSPIHVGKTAIFNSNEDIYHGMNLLVFRANPKLHNSYLEHYLKFIFQCGYWKNVCKQSVNQASVNQQDINKVKINYPNSLHEQKRIVAILDEAFAAIDKAKANTQKNLQNAKELFDSYLQGVFENKGELYQVRPFGEVCDLIGGSQPSKNDFVYEARNGYIRLIQVRDYRTDKYITYIPKNKARRFCTKDDIMIGRYGPPIFGIFKGLEGAYNVALMKADVKTEICNPDYFFWFLKTNNLRLFVEKSSKRAAGQDGVRKELLDKYPVPIPELAQQKKIANKIEELLSETKKLETIYQQKLNSLEELKKSILQKAFSGELTEKTVLV